MTPEERQLISGLFERMRSYGAPDKDRDAEALIAREVRANPDATYMLVQSVLIQEQALEASTNRVQDLEDQLRAMEGGGEQRGARSGGFLGGAWNSGRRDEEPRSSVPQVGARATPSAYESRSPWSQGGGAPQAQPQAQQQAPAPSGGGFMKSALATAAGVAGGMVLADSLRGMLGGGAHASPSTLAGPREGADAKYQDASDNDPGTDNDPGGDDADNDPGFDSGGSDDGIEI